ncbi:MORN repeat protein [Allofrancisella inopinata]|uniref:MORN repeat protein n=1 Tax=Allofrancisella inopinata TaxID=1085647 RepID=A0AAE6YG81_9GAMM|nr:hypothetical protein [Allofrancisella inopinata]QIV95335.1 hypothetical protein E4K63_00165 [Allofrancisella inopinata]TDT65066.1 MORN repeat protein [Allofrancisella inopinata]
MKRRLLLFTGIFSFTSFYAIPIKNTEVKDGLIYQKNNPAEPYTGKVSSYFENGKIKSEISFKKGKPTGVANGWYDNGKKRYSYYQIDGLKNGESTLFDKDGMIKSIEFFKKNKLISYKEFDSTNDKLAIDASEYLPIFNNINYKYRNYEKHSKQDSKDKYDIYKYSVTFTKVSCDKNTKSCIYKLIQGVNKLEEVYAIKKSGIYSYLKKLNDEVLDQNEYLKSKTLVLANILSPNENTKINKLKAFMINNHKYNNCIELNQKETSHSHKVPFYYNATKLTQQTSRIYCKNIGMTETNEISSYFIKNKEIGKTVFRSILDPRSISK